MKLRNRILTFALPLTLIPFVIMALAVYYFLIRANQIRIQEEQSTLLSETVVNLRKELQDARKSLALLTGVPAILDYLAALAQKADSETIREKEESARSIMKLFFDQNPYYLQLSLTDARGRERIKVSKLPGQEELSSIADEDFFVRTLITGRVQAPVRELQPTRFATFLAQRVARTEFLGAVVLYLDAEVFQRSLRPLLAGHGFSTFMFDDRGLKFAESFASAEEEAALRQINLTSEATSLLAKPSLDVSQKEISSGARRYAFSVHPAEAYERTRFEPQAGENWFLGVLRPKEDLAGQTGSFQAIFIILLLSASGAVIWAATRYARRVTEPLEQVSEATSEIARGQFGVNLDIATGDEVQDLASAVKQMAGELKDYQSRLVRSAKLAAIGEMASEMSHEIQNRISGLSLWIQYLDSEIGLDDPRREYLEEMKQGLKGFMDLLADLKQLYRTPVLEPTDVDLNLLARETLPYVEDRARERNVRIELYLDPDLPAIFCDAEKVRSVLLNLLINGIDSIEGEGRIIVRTLTSNLNPTTGAPDGKAVMISVSDTGGGIAEEHLSHIFYPFYSTKAGGSGLGLAISSSLVAVHGGRIEVDSRIGEGTTFTVILPLMPLI